MRKDLSLYLVIIYAQVSLKLPINWREISVLSQSIFFTACMSMGGAEVTLHRYKIEIPHVLLFNYIYYICVIYTIKLERGDIEWRRTHFKPHKTHCKSRQVAHTNLSNYNRNRNITTEHKCICLLN